MSTNRSRPNVLFNPILPREAIMGRIKELRDSYGFIAGDDGYDYFFHWASIQKSSDRDYDALEVRDRVSFLPQPPRDENSRQPRGIEIMYIPENVRVVPEGMEPTEPEKDKDST